MFRLICIKFLVILLLIFNYDKIKHIRSFWYNISVKWQSRHSVVTIFAIIHDANYDLITETRSIKMACIDIFIVTISLTTYIHVYLAFLIFGYAKWQQELRIGNIFLTMFISFYLFTQIFLFVIRLQSVFKW